MIPTRKEQEYKNLKYVDGVRPQDFPLSYNYLLLCSCLEMHPSILFIYYNKATQKRFYSFCYLIIPESEKLILLVLAADISAPATLARSARADISARAS